MCAPHAPALTQFCQEGFLHDTPASGGGVSEEKKLTTSMLDAVHMCRLIGTSWFYYGQLMFLSFA